MPFFFFTFFKIKYPFSILINSKTEKGYTKLAFIYNKGYNISIYKYTNW